MLKNATKEAALTAQELAEARTKSEHLEKDVQRLKVRFSVVSWHRSGVGGIKMLGELGALSPWTRSKFYSTQIHPPPPLRFHCVGRCLDGTQDSCDFCIAVG